MKRFIPETGSVADWNAAYHRLEDYLRAHQVENRLLEEQIIQEVLLDAAAEHQKNQSVSPTTLAMQKLFQRMDLWFQLLLRAEQIQPNQISAHGRLTWFSLDASRRWPWAFLTYEEFPPELLRAVHERTVVAGPDLQISSMVPRDLDVPPPLQLDNEQLGRWARLHLPLVITGLFLVSLVFLLF
jgi:hypothetical protein